MSEITMHSTIRPLFETSIVELTSCELDTVNGACRFTWNGWGAVDWANAGAWGLAGVAVGVRGGLQGAIIGGIAGSGASIVSDLINLNCP